MSVAVFSGKETYKLKLRRIGILILIHHDISESLSVIVQYLRMLLKEFYGKHDDIIKIKGITSLKSLLVFFIGFLSHAWPHTFLDMVVEAHFVFACLNAFFCDGLTAGSWVV